MNRTPPTSPMSKRRKIAQVSTLSPENESREISIAEIQNIPPPQGMGEAEWEAVVDFITGMLFPDNDNIEGGKKTRKRRPKSRRKSKTRSRGKY